MTRYYSKFYNGSPFHIFLTLLLLSVSISTHGVTKFACNYFPPFKISNTGDLKGIDIDVINEVYRDMGREVNFSFLPWKRALYSVNNGTYDALCGCSYLKSREKDLYYTKELGLTSIGIYTLKESSIKFKTLDDLKGLNLAVIRGYNLEEELKAKNFNITPVNSELQLINLLKSKRVDAFYSYEAPIKFILKTRNMNNNFNYKELRSSPNYVCFSKKRLENKKLVEQFNKSLIKIKKKGYADKIRLKYLGN